MLTAFRLVAVLAVGLMPVACTTSTQSATKPVSRLPAWRLTVPAHEGLDAALVGAIDAAVRSNFRGVTSVLVARHGRLAIERYYGIRATDQVPIFSITKTVVSALVGIALAEGRLANVNERLSDIIGGADRRIRLRHLLSMTAGYGRGLNFGSTDASTLANRPLINPPGTTFWYDSGSSDLLAEVVSRATGMTAADYARRRLLGPTGIRDVAWPGSHGGSGLLLRPRELLAFGQMYLNRGTWNGRRVVPESWVRTSTRTHITVPPGQGISDGYGYDWWIESRGTHFFAAHGYLGQALVVVPRLDEVISITSSRDSGLGLLRLILKATHA